MKQSKSSDADFVKFGIEEEAFFIKCFTVTDVSQSKILFLLNLSSSSVSTVLAYGLFGHAGISPTADDIDRLPLKISAQTISVAQNYSQHSQSRDEFNWLYHAYLNRNIKKYLSKEKKDETKHGNFCKNWLCQNFSCCPKDLSCPKFEEGGLAAPSSPGPYAYGCSITCFFNQTH